MHRCLITLMLLALYPGAGSALGQPAVFYDDFKGNALLPHWNQPPAWQWQYNVSNSMLNITATSHPSKSTGMIAVISPQTDFQADVWMGWEAAGQPQWIDFTVFNAGSTIATFGYRNTSLIPQIFANAPGQFVSMPAPGPGMHHVRITRTGTQMDFHFDGSQFASFSGTSGMVADRIGFLFLAPYPGQLGSFHIDRVQIVPGPGTLFLLPTLALGWTRRRRF